MVVQLPLRAGPDPYADEDDYRDWSEDDDEVEEEDEEQVGCLPKLFKEHGCVA